jgi:RNA-directed DNA polymerase
MHRPIPGEGNWPKQVVNGFFVYYAVPTNFCVLLEFRARINGRWLRTLRRRSQKDQTNWERITMLADDFLPQPRILHPWPNHRFGVTHPRWAGMGKAARTALCGGLQ